MLAVMRQRGIIYFTAALFSILLSVWAALKTSVINPDAICYLYSARAMEHGLMLATHLCDQAKWPFYSMLIFGVTKLTSLSLTASAYCLDGFFSLISVMAFIAIVNSFTHRTRIIILAAIVILLAHEFNNLRVDIIRDHGFWAFYLLSLFFALRYFMTQKGCYALLWSTSLIVATLFRIEGILFLLLFPLAAFLGTRQRLKTFLQLNILTLFGGSILLIGLWLHPQQALGRLTEIPYGAIAWIHSFQRISEALVQNVLSVYAVHDALYVAIGMMSVWYLLSVISNVSFIYAVLVLYAWWKKIAGFSRETYLVLWTYIAINVLITSVFLVENLFLSARYLVALSLVLMLWVPFSLDYLRKWPLWLAGILVIVYGLGGIFDFGHSKKYIRESGDWLATHAAAQQKIYSNDYQLLYYSNHFGDAIFTTGRAYENINVIAQGKWRQYDYIALRLSENEWKKNAIVQEIHLTPVAVFQNDRGDQVRIYQNK